MLAKSRTLRLTGGGWGSNAGMSILTIAKSILIASVLMSWDALVQPSAELATTRARFANNQFFARQFLDRMNKMNGMVELVFCRRMIGCQGETLSSQRNSFENANHRFMCAIENFA